VAPKRVVSVRAESKAATAVAPAPSAAAGQEHEQLQQYGVFKLSYDTANVGGVAWGGGPCVGELFKSSCCLLQWC
jgi:hypothetical protein